MSGVLYSWVLYSRCYNNVLYAIRKSFQELFWKCKSI